MAITLGYGERLKHIGRVITRKTKWHFPRNDIPTIEVGGYSFDAKMMDEEPEKPKDRRFMRGSFSDIVAQVAARYPGLKTDIDPSPDAPRNRHQNTGVSDYQVCKAAANLTGYFFWVEGDADGVWTLHFKSPANVLDAENQPDLTLRYNDGDLTTLFSFDPELLVQGAKTKIRVQFKNPKTGKIVTEEVEESESSEDIEALEQTGEAQEEHKAATRIKIFFQDYSFVAETKKQFKTAAEAKQWAAQWFRRQRENFILGKGTCIGIETLRSRQFHTLEGLGKTLSGRWYLSRVKHRLSDSDGYECTFNSRKQDSLE
jgi:phage protein D